MSYICGAPWYSLYLGADGSIRPCCVYPDSFGQYQDSSSLQKIWDGSQMQELRETFIKGHIPKGCETCTHKEDLGRLSKKQKYDRTYKKFGLPIPQTASTGPRPLVLDLAFSNVCNLSCAMCSAKVSSRWNLYEAEMQDIQGRGRVPYVPFQVSADENTFREFAEFCSDAKQITVLGGEPFSSESFYQFLLCLQKAGKNPEMSIVSNGTLLKEKWWPVLNALTNTALAFSIDGIGETYELVRGISFSIFQERIRNSLRNLSPRSIHFTFTLSLLNMADIQNTANWVAALQTEFPHHYVKLWISQIVSWPPQLDPSFAPAILRAEAIHQLDNISRNHSELLIDSHVETLNQALQKGLPESDKPQDIDIFVEKIYQMRNMNYSSSQKEA